MELRRWSIDAELVARFAVDLAGFLAALRTINPADGPRPGKHNWFRGGTLRTYDGVAQKALAELDGHLDFGLAREIWKSALDAKMDGAESWFHGDIAGGNLLLNDGQLAAVIDFGTCGVGDPACDLAVAWTLLTAESRQAFRERLPADEDTWARGRGWALRKTLAICANTYGDDEAASARRVLGEILREYVAGSQSPTPNPRDFHDPGDFPAVCAGKSPGS